jgi:predicted TIM-barrel fold metal-dependent hydrolase
MCLREETAMISRRTAMERIGLVTLGAAVGVPRDAGSQTPVSNSTGTNVPTLKAPPDAADCHMHIYNPTWFPMAPSTRVPPADAAVSDYRALQRRIGTSRVVVVTPRNYGTDNRVTLDAIWQLGSDARGVAVLHPSVSDAELKNLHDGGIRGIRFSLSDPSSAVVTIDMAEPLAKRVAELGWHLQFNIQGPQIVQWADLLRRLPAPLVFDHMGFPTLPAGTSHPSHVIVRDLVERGRAWVKLSGAYANSRMGPPYLEAATIARSFVQAAPERLVWGSDWPHPSEPPDRKPNDALLFDLVSQWAPDAAARHRILVENPAALYGFGRS